VPEKNNKFWQVDAKEKAVLSPKGEGETTAISDAVCLEKLNKFLT